MKLERLESPAAVARRAADRVQAVLVREPEAALVLPAGRTPVPLYAELVRRARAGELDLSRAHLFQLDELCGVAPADARSFQAFLRAHLLDLVPHHARRVHLLDGSAAEPERACARHARELAAAGGARLVLLGIGRNGHVAFNEPGSSPAAPARVVELSATTVAGLEAAFGAGRVPRRGLTLGLFELAAGRELVLLATGAAKAPALRALLTDAPSPALPASLLSAHHDLTVLADADACSALSAAGAH